MPDQIVRPRWISVTAGLLFAAGIFNILMAFTGATARYGMFYPAVQVLLTIGYLTALSGIWEMERWGFILLPFVLVAALATDLWLGAFRYYNLLPWLPMIVFWIEKRRFR
jgi:hypothetical protein